MEPFTRYWWLFILRGVFALAFGVLALVRPGAALLALVIVFGAYALLDGVAALVFAFRKDNPHRGWSIFEGVTGVAAGLLTLLVPGITALTLYVLIASWAVLTGIAEIVIAIRLRRELKGEGWLIAQGLLSVAFGILMVALPAVGVIALVALISAFAFIAGTLWVALGIRLGRLDRASRADHPHVGTRPQAGVPI
jgi:uncharacterized membrane protein HdeD (DUF308 family)